MKITKKQLTKIIKEELEGLHGQPAGPREMLGNDIAGALEGALEGLLKQKDLDPGVLNNIMLDVEHNLLDIAIAVSDVVGDHTDLPPRPELDPDDEW